MAFRDCQTRCYCIARDIQAIARMNTVKKVQACNPISYAGMSLHNGSICPIFLHKS